MKLRELLEEYADNIEIKRDDTTHKVPVLYARQKGATQPSTQVQRPQTTINRPRTTQIPNNLMQWAWMGDFRQVVSDLKNMALKERWYYKVQNPAFPIVTGKQIGRAHV